MPGGRIKVDVVDVDSIRQDNLEGVNVLEHIFCCRPVGGSGECVDIPTVNGFE